MPLRHIAVALLLILILSGCGATLQAPPPPAPAAAAQPVPWYEPEIRAFEAADRASPPPPGRVLFIGSSSIRLWAALAEDLRPAPIINRGFGGSKTADVLAVFDRIVPVCRPSAIVYYCGDNDLGTDNTDSGAAADGFIEFDRRARALWPGVKVFYIAIKASRARWGNWPAMQRANELVRAYCERTPGAIYLDTVTPTLLPDGTPDPSIFLEDGLHLSPKGYAIWTSVIREPVLRAWTESRASPQPY
ncbi:MAG: hypothetical protein IT436_07325 [Phycisphaerales bacterium]|nr:hypothetical protein [Phycisphaerales bacterium]